MRHIAWSYSMPRVWVVGAVARWNQYGSIWNGCRVI